MAGTKMGSLKSKLGLRGPTKPGDMISRMNKMKSAPKGAKISNKRVSELAA